MPGAWIEAARQQMRVVCNHSAVLWVADYQGWCAFRPKEHGSAADNARAAERRRLGSVCRGSKLNAQRHSQLLEACGSLQAALASVFESKGRRTKKAAAAVSLLHLWGPEEQAAFKDLQAAIMDSMTLAFPDPDKSICVLTDGSDRFCAGLVTQVDEEQLDIPMDEQDHQPLAFLSGEFKDAQLRWTVSEKEGFAIIDTVTKVDYLSLSHDEFSILSDHLNLTYIYNPLSADPTLARHVVHKVQRWAFKMSVFS
jgi:RNase H-like domain found in reverse transcriptase